MAEYIERAEVLKRLKEIQNDDRYGKDDMIDEVIETPAAEVNPAIAGEWVSGLHMSKGRELHPCFTCGVCHRCRRRKTRYCPNCGAYMRNGE